MPGQVAPNFTGKSLWFGLWGILTSGFFVVTLRKNGCLQVRPVLFARHTTNVYPYQSHLRSALGQVTLSNNRGLTLHLHPLDQHKV